MSMATRCIHCGTVFRVVPDQLKVSEGWVRCGRCNDVFNALETMFDLERDAPPPWQPPVVAEAPAADEAAPQLPSDLPADLPSETHPADAHPEIAVAVHDHRPDEPTFAAQAGDVSVATLLDLPSPVEPPQPVAPAADEAVVAAPAPPPSMMRPAQLPRGGAGAAREPMHWQRPALVLAVLLSTLLLAGQALHHFRHRVAAQWPAARPALAAWCGLAHCGIEPLRRVEDLTLESTGLTRVPGGASMFRLSAAVRNRGPYPVALPSFDLALTDSNGQLLARRALARADFSAAPAVIAAGSEAVLQTTIATSGAVTGYTVELFYP